GHGDDDAREREHHLRADDQHRELALDQLVGAEMIFQAEVEDVLSLAPARAAHGGTVPPPRRPPRNRLALPVPGGLNTRARGRLAQMDRASVSEAEGHWFESSSARHSNDLEPFGFSGLPAGTSTVFSAAGNSRVTNGAGIRPPSFS